MNRLKNVEIFTDGACSGNPGPGGYGAVLRCDGKEKELSGAEELTTNNRMELRAVIEALKALKYPCCVTLTTDSTYVCNAIEKGWAQGWKKKNWMVSPGKPRLNADLWAELLDLLDIHSVTVVWVRGHNGHPENERCDALATGAIKKLTEM